MVDCVIMFVCGMLSFDYVGILFCWWGDFNILLMESLEEVIMGCLCGF